METSCSDLIKDNESIRISVKKIFEILISKFELVICFQFSSGNLIKNYLNNMYTKLIVKNFRLIGDFNN